MCYVLVTTPLVQCETEEDFIDLRPFATALEAFSVICELYVGENLSYLVYTVGYFPPPLPQRNKAPLGHFLNKTTNVTSPRASLVVKLLWSKHRELQETAIKIWNDLMLEIFIS